MPSISWPLTGPIGRNTGACLLLAHLAVNCVCLADSDVPATAPDPPVLHQALPGTNVAQPPLSGPDWPLLSPPLADPDEVVASPTSSAPKAPTPEDIPSIARAAISRQDEPAGSVIPVARLQPVPLPPRDFPEVAPPAPPLPEEQAPAVALSLAPFAGTPKARCGVQCTGEENCRRVGWGAERPIPWEVFAQGEYVGPARTAHVPEYRLRVDDLVEFVYRLTMQPSDRPYRLSVRDRIRIESLTASQTVDREVTVEPDGTITLRMLGQVPAAGLTLEELRKELDRLYSKQIENPSITVTPVLINSVLEELRASVDARYGTGGQNTQARITPEGTAQLPAIGSVPAQGLTLPEFQREIEERYARIVGGLEVTPILRARAPRFVYVLGEVRIPGRFPMEGPTTAMQAIALAGGWNKGAHLKHIVVFRRDECWRLMATKLSLCGPLFGTTPCPADEIWLRDSDIVLVPKSPLLAADDLIELTFTRGLYSVFPMGVTLNFSKLSTL